jgi:carboxymethylenebutenolidase
MVRFHVVASLVAATLVASLAASPAPAQDGKKPAPAAAPAPTASPAQQKPLGGLSEEEFAKLHTLKEGEAPPAKGTMVDLADGTKAYLTLPENAKPGLPAVIVIQEWWGLNSHIKYWADRLTLTGRAALAVDLYGGKTATDRTTALQMMQAANKDIPKAVATLLAARDFVKKDPRVAASKVGSIGWCFGGGMSLQLAINAPDLDACVMYYGFPVNDPALLAKIKAPILGIFGNKDQGIPPMAVDAFDKALTDAKVDHKFFRYDAPHAFANPSNDIYDAKSAADAFEKVKAFFDEKLPVKAATKG